MNNLSNFSKWYVEYSCPWGHAISYYEKQFMEINGKTHFITRYRYGSSSAKYNPKAKIKFYVFVGGEPNKIDDKINRKGERIHRFKTYDETLTYLSNTKL